MAMPNSNVFCLVDAVPSTDLSVLDRAIAYGDGLFDACFSRPQHRPLWPKHMARLQHGCDVLGIPFPDDLIAASVAQFDTHLDKQILTDDQAFKLKLLVSRGLSGVGYRTLPRDTVQPRLILTAARFDRDYAKDRKSVV